MIEFGDCRETMRRWAAQDVKAQTCVTSPPYYGLRDYGHDGQIGLEETPEAYITAMVEVFRCAWDVLADDGTLWLNIGDSYAAQRGGTHMPAQTVAGGVGGKGDDKAFRGMGDEKRGAAHRNASAIGLKHKDLIGIPWMLAFALRADGWYLRQDIIWHKPNPMPESVTDRCTKCHEYIFLLSKSQSYYYNADAIAEPAKYWGERDRTNGKYHNEGTGLSPHRGLTGVKSDSRAGKGRIAYEGKRTEGNTSGGQESFVSISETRNRRSVWTVTTKPYAGAHFATFPPDLIEPCILAGAPAGGIVLDPFMGSGTTAAVAIKHGRGYLGCELNPAYAELQQERIRDATLSVAQMSLEYI